MAFPFVLRRASSSIIPLAIRPIGSPRPFRRVLSGASTVENGEVVHARNRRGSVPSLRFSTESADESLIRVIESEIELTKNKYEKMYSLAYPPVYFPFKFIDRYGERTLLLTKNYQDELIKFKAEIPRLEDIKEEKPEDWDSDDENKIVSVSYAASITKGSGMCLEFLGTISNEEICIHSVLIKQPEVSEDRAYEGPSFIDLDENLQKAFLKYLAIRGIDFNTFYFMPHHMLKKRHREYFLWLEKIKNFIEKPPHL